MTHRYTTSLAPITNGFEANLVQVWQLVGLSCWQRTLIQQQVDWIIRRGGSIESHYPRVEWMYRDSLAEKFGASESPEKIPDWDVVVLSVDLVAPPLNSKLVPSDEKGEPTIVAQLCDWLFENRIRSDQVGILWDWTSQPSSSLVLASELGFSGVISDPESLRDWIQVLMARGAARTRPAHPLLQNISIPSLSSPSLSTPER